MTELDTRVSVLETKMNVVEKNLTDEMTTFKSLINDHEKREIAYTDKQHELLSEKFSRLEESTNYRIKDLKSDILEVASKRKEDMEVINKKLDSLLNTQSNLVGLKNKGIGIFLALGVFATFIAGMGDTFLQWAKAFF